MSMDLLKIRLGRTEMVAGCLVAYFQLFIVLLLRLHAVGPWVLPSIPQDLRRSHLGPLQCSKSDFKSVVLMSTGEIVGSDISPRQWLESKPEGAYTVLRCNTFGVCQGTEFHVSRLQESHNIICSGSINGNTTSTAPQDISAKATSAIRRLKECGPVVLRHPVSGWMVTLYVKTEGEDAIIEGNLYPISSPPLNTSPESVSVCVIEAKDLPTRQPCPQAKRSSWCVERKPLEALTPEGCDETILQDPQNGALLEGLTSNLFIVRSDGILLTAPSESVLGGYVRQLLLDSQLFHISHEPILLQDAQQWKYVFLTSTIRILTPVKRIIRVNDSGIKEETVWRSGPDNETTYIRNAILSIMSKKPR